MANLMTADQALLMLSEVDSNASSDYGESESDGSESDGLQLTSEDTSSSDSLPESSSSEDEQRTTGRGCTRGRGRGRGRGTGRGQGRGTGRGQGSSRGRGQGRGRGRGVGRASKRPRLQDNTPVYDWQPVTEATDTAPPTHPFTESSGPHVPQEVQTPEQCFFVFFTMAVWQFLVDKTNQYARRKMASSLYQTWKPVTVQEMKGFVAVILNMGIIQLNNLKDYWATDDTTNLPFFRSVFSRDRFFQIFGALHVGDVDDPSKRGKIQPLLDILCPVFQAAYTPKKEIAIDESVISFRGRVSFRQYLKGKPNPWGIKAFVLADSKSGYLYNLLIYFGKETLLIDQPDLPHTSRVVMTLIEGLQHKGYDLYIDRFYSSPFLATELGKVGITVTGTVQVNRKGLPPVFKEKKKEASGTIVGYRANDLLTFYWVDKRKVFVLTTKHKLSTDQLPARRSRSATRKPTAIVDYNEHMLGVDKLDQLVSYYSFLHKSVKWWRKVFFWMVEVTVVNSYVIYKELAVERGDRPITHIQFRRRLIEELSEPMRCQAIPRSRSGHRSAERLERLRPERHFMTKGTKRRDCVVCSVRGEGGSRHLTLFYCDSCAEKPSMCPTNCFQKYHTKRNFKD